MFAPEEVETGEGLTSALVYEQAADAAAWLVRRGKTALSELEEAEGQDTALLTATEAAEDAVRELLRCAPRTDGQGLIFPAIGAYDATGRLLAEDEIPRDYLRGIRLLAEHVAAGTFMLRRSAAPSPTIEEERSRYGGIKYRAGADHTTLETNHPEEWRLILSVVPPL